MKVALLHLSDIHFTVAPHDIESRADLIVSAMRSVESDFDACLVLISGDIAYSGHADEYSKADAFFVRVKSTLAALNLKTAPSLLFAPGNHDCNHSGHSEIRKLLIDRYRSNISELAETSDVLGALLSVQQPYATFAASYGMRDDFLDQVCSTYNYNLDGHTIQVHIYNSALLSQLKNDQASLAFPIHFAERSIKYDKASSLSISMIHHPLNWLEANNALRLRTFLEGTSDLLLTGHQHFETAYSKTNRTGESTLYYEGAALQDPDSSPSGFNVLCFDLATKRYRSSFCKWNGSIYVPEEGEWADYKRSESKAPRFINTPSFVEQLNDAGITYSHRFKELVTLSDIFLYPNLQVRNPVSNQKSVTVRSGQTLEYFKGAKRVVVLGTKQSGKSSLAKTLYKDLQGTTGTLPVLAKGTDFATRNIERNLKVLWRLVAQQYGDRSVEYFKQEGPGKKTLIVDDWHTTRLNGEAQAVLLEELGNHFERIILIAEDLFQMQELTLPEESKKVFLAMPHVTIAPFGHVLRGQLIEQWLKMGQEDTIDQKVFIHEVDKAERRVSAVIGRNVLPSQPFVILAILHASEQESSASNQNGAYGYLFEVLITRALAKVSTDISDVDTMYMTLSRLAATQFEQNLPSLSGAEAARVIEDYARQYAMKLNSISLLKTFVDERILVVNDGNYSFRYSYLYHYFIARNFAHQMRENPDDPITRSKIESMTDRIMSDEYTNILMFFVYLTRDPAVMKRLVTNANSMFAGSLPCELGADVEAFGKLDIHKPKVELPEDNVAKHRREQREAQDAEDEEAEYVPEDRRLPYSEDLEDGDKIAIASKTLDLLGQVVRNFPGSVPAETKKEIVKSTYFLGLRMTTAALQYIVYSVDELRSLLSESTSEGERAKIVAQVDQLMLLLGEFMVTSLFKQISQSVGLDRLAETYHDVLEENRGNMAVRLIDLSIKLDHFGEFPDKEVRTIHQDLADRFFPLEVLRNLVIMHFMMFHVDYRIRQSIGQLLGFPAMSPLFMDNPEKLLSQSDS